MTLHPIHPMTVHFPLACWLFVPLCDVLAVVMGQDFLRRAAALLCAFGAIAGLVAATFGAMDYPRARHKAARLVAIHAVLMALAWTLSTASLIGRIDAAYAAILPPPAWALAASTVALVVAIAGAACGGEMVYGRGVGVRDR